MTDEPTKTIASAEPARARKHAIVLGIDPGTRVVGYGALVDAPRGPRFLAAGVLRARAQLSVAQRLAWIQSELESLLMRIGPGIVVVERAFASRNMQSALRIGEGRGVILACAARSGADVVEVAPAAAKKAVLGHGGADKTQVARMVAQILRLKELPSALDATDALALALAHVARRARGDLALVASARGGASDAIELARGADGRRGDRSAVSWNKTRKHTLRARAAPALPESFLATPRTLPKARSKTR